MARIDIQSNVKSPSRVAEGQPIVGRGTRDGALFTAGYTLSLALEGRIFVAPHTTAANTALTAQTSFVNSTPFLLLDVPAGTTAILQSLALAQTGAAATNPFPVILEIDTLRRYASGGTVETAQSTRTDQPVGVLSGVFANPVAIAGFGKRVYATTLKADVTNPNTTENLLWVPEVPHVLVGPASFLVFTWSAGTAPTFFYSLSWAEIPTSSIN